MSPLPVWYRDYFMRYGNTEREVLDSIWNDVPGADQVWEVIQELITEIFSGRWGFEHRDWPKIWALFDDDYHDEADEEVPLFPPGYYFVPDASGASRELRLVAAAEQTESSAPIRPTTPAIESQFDSVSQSEQVIDRWVESSEDQSFIPSYLTTRPFGVKRVRRFKRECGTFRHARRSVVENLQIIARLFERASGDGLLPDYRPLRPCFDVAVNKAQREIIRYRHYKKENVRFENALHHYAKAVHAFAKWNQGPISYFADGLTGQSLYRPLDCWYAEMCTSDFEIEELRDFEIWKRGAMSFKWFFKTFDICEYAFELLSDEAIELWEAIFEMTLVRDCDCFIPNFFPTLDFESILGNVNVDNNDAVSSADVTPELTRESSTVSTSSEVVSIASVEHQSSPPLYVPSASYSATTEMAATPSSSTSASRSMFFRSGIFGPSPSGTSSSSGRYQRVKGTVRRWLLRNKA